jgi:hypothetical protein
MQYQDLSGEMPLANIIEALDDDGDGAADDSAWAAVQASAEERIAEAFGGSVPAEYASGVTHARKLFLLEILYRRRGFTGERNPFSSQASKAEDRLRKLATGEETPQGAGGGSAITEPAKINGITGLMA